MKNIVKAFVDTTRTSVADNRNFLQFLEKQSYIKQEYKTSGDFDIRILIIFPKIGFNFFI